MNRYDEKYIFRKATTEDIEDIALFFNQEWKKNGILSVPQILRYEFSGKGSDLNIILAILKENGSIQGLWAFYPFSDCQEALDVAGGPWCVKQDKEAMPFLGNEIMQRARHIIGYRTMLGIGDNPRTSGIYHRCYRKDVCGRLRHYYILNDDIDYQIAIIEERKKGEIPLNDRSDISSCEIDCIAKIEDAFWSNIDKKEIPYKDKEYIEKRFFTHPVYQYHAVGIYLYEELKAIVFMRVVKIGESSVNRIVDYIGDKSYLTYLYFHLQMWMKQNSCEYTDFYNYGFEQRLMFEAGFVEREENDKNIIPNYFEPFVQKNIEIYFSAPIQNVTLCKADGDQDRPNSLNVMNV